MRNYIVKRLLLSIPTVVLVSVIVFLTIRLIPGNVVDLMSANMGEAGTGIIGQNRAKIEQALGLDKPFLTQYGIWLGDIILHGNLGRSLWDQTPVLEKISERWPVTLELGIFGILIAQLIALPIGIYSALRQDTVGDYISRSFAIICIAAPSFWVATLVVIFPSMWWGWSPPITLVTFQENPIANLQMFIIPAIILGMSMSGTTMRMTRTVMLEVLRQDYIRTAWAKGLRERIVVMRHALKNSMIPVVTIIGMGVPTLVGGTIVIEQIFQLPGMGTLLMNSLQNRDYPIISGMLLIFGVALALINLGVDLTYGFLDPRVHYR